MVAMAKKKPEHLRDFERMKDSEVLNQVIHDFEASEAFQRPFFDKFKRWYAQYKAYRSDEEIAEAKNKGKSILYIPKTFEIIETLLPKIVLGLFSTLPYTDVRALSGPDPDTQTELINNLLTYQLTQEIGIVPKAAGIVKEAAIYGTVHTYQHWMFEQKDKVIREINEDGSFRDVLTEVVDKDHPDIECIPILDFFFDPAAKDIDDSRYCIRRRWADKHELKNSAKLRRKYKNLDDIKETEDGSSYGDSADDYMPSEVGISLGTNTRKSIEILEYWTDDWVVEVANRSVVIRSEENPNYHRRKPFAKLCLIPQANEYYGISIAEMLQGLQEELNVTRNQRIDNVALVLNKVFKVKHDSVVDPKRVISKAGGVIEVDEMDDIQQLETTDVTSSSYNEEAVIKDDMDHVSGVYDSVRGSTPVRRETATTMTLLTSAGGDRFKMMILVADAGWRSKVISQLVELNKQYLESNKTIFLPNPGRPSAMETADIGPRDLVGEFKYMVKGSAVDPTISKEIKQSVWIQLLQYLQNDPYVNHVELLKQVFQVFDVQDPESLVNEQPALPLGMDIAGLMGGSGMPPGMGTGMSPGIGMGQQFANSPTGVEL
jgi:hypothetical protein